MKTPLPLGLKKSFGYGDRLGLAGPGHIAANARHDFAPIFAQQSIREMARTNRTPTDVMNAARTALDAANYSGPWGADADHLKTPADVDVTAAAGFTFFTIDPSEFVVNAADTMSAADLEAAFAEQVKDKVYGEEDVAKLYLETVFETEGSEHRFDKETFLRAAVKYGRATAHCEKMARHMADTIKRPYEIEVSVDETDSPTSPLEHLFFANELRRRAISVVSLAPRFIGEFEKGVDYKGDFAAFEKALTAHVAIAKAFGPYKISIHSGSDKFSIYPIIGRVCGDLLHVKTAGTSYLEALRVIARAEPALFREIVDYSGGRFAEDRKTYHISVTESDVPGLLATPAADLERVLLDENNGRQLLHVTFGSVLTKGVDTKGRPFRDSILETLEARADLHREFLEKHLGRHLDELVRG